METAVHVKAGDVLMSTLLSAGAVSVGEMGGGGAKINETVLVYVSEIVVPTMAIGYVPAIAPAVLLMVSVEVNVGTAALMLNDAVEPTG